MAPEPIQHWLKVKCRKAFLSAVIYALFELAVGTFMLALTLGLAFVIAKTLLLWMIPLAAAYLTAPSLLVALVIGGLLFLDSVYARRDDMSLLPIWFAREYLDIGPRLVLDGFHSAKRARSFFRLNVPACAKVLAYLATKTTPSSQAELLGRFPDLVWPALAAQLRIIPGVILFRPAETRVSLIMPLRLELRGLLAGQEPARAFDPEEPPAVPVTEPEELSSSEILGVSSSATLAEIKAAYRHRVKECHPDHFANMDQTSRDRAEEWTKALNAAYEDLVRTHGKSRG